MSQKSAEHKLKERTLNMIWGCTVGMFALCIPLSEVTESGLILPILVVLGAVISTAIVWLTPRYRKSDRPTMTALEERIINLETIYTSLPNVDAAFPFLNQENH